MFFSEKVETCAIMEREARKVPKKQYASNSKEQVCLSNATEDMENTYNEKGMRNRIQSKRQSLQIYRWGGGGGVPPRAPH